MPPFGFKILRVLGEALSIIERADPQAARLVGSELRPVISPDVGTAAVSDTGELLVNPEFLGHLPVTQIAGVLYHELLHWVFVHRDRPAITQDQEWAWVIAREVAVNHAVLRAGFELPEGRVLEEPVEKYGLDPSRMTTAEMAALILEKGSSAPQ